MIIKKPAALLVCVAAAALLFLGNTQVSQSQNAQMKLGGAWVGSGAAGLWNALQIPLDPAGKTCAARVSAVAMPGFAPLMAALDADTFADMVGQVEMITRDTAKNTFIGYATKGVEVKAILVMTGTFQFKGPNNALVNYSIAVFSPATDKDKDGLPDPGSTPMIPPIEGADAAKRVTP